MRILLIFLFLQCAVIEKSKPLPIYAKEPNREIAIQPPVFVVINYESYRNGYKGLSESNSNHILDQLKKSGKFQNIETNIEKADLILEIEIQNHKTNNRYLPYMSVLTLSLIPYFQTIELSEKFRLIKKDGEVVFKSDRIQNLNYWFGLVFIIKGMIQFSEQDSHNRFGFEGDLIEKLNQSIIDEFNIKK